MVTYIGCSGWSYKDWKNVFYPDDLPTPNYFTFYANYFNTVEVNSSYYHFPSDTTLQSWLKRAPKNFKFTFKVSREITHIKKMRGAQELITQFYGMQDILQDQLGCFLFQFPPSIRYTKDNLEHILAHLDPRYKNVLEFRHTSWWAPEAIKQIKDHHITFCTVSGFGLPENLNITDGMAYIRFHGKPPYSGCYTEHTLSLWADKVKKSGVKQIYAYFNNTIAARAVENASYFKRLLQPDLI